MDLNLKGSQINLVARQKQKPKYLSSPTNQPLSRPHSATFFSKRSRFSPLFCRPQSADSKFRRKIDRPCGQYGFGGEYQSRLSKKDKLYESVSSSDLLQLLLDEPIRRSWLCRGSPAEGASSPDEATDCFSSQRFSKNSNLSKYRTNAVIAGSRKGSRENKPIDLRSLVTSCEIKPLPARIHNNFTASKMSRVNSADGKNSPGRSASKASASDYWNSSTYASLCKAKPDLPGRVSFSNATAAKDVDSSDCDNDRQEGDQLCQKKESVISAPGPMMLSHDMGPSTSAKNTVTKPSAEVSSAGLKKSVHFDSAGESDIFGQTYEYPKCPSENCSCSTSSSTTASMHDTGDACKYTVDSEKELQTPLEVKSSTVTDTNWNLDVKKVIKEDSSVTRENKNQIEERLTKEVVNKSLEEANSKLNILNNVESPAANHSGEYTAAPKSHLEKQNNFLDFLNTNTKNQTMCKSSSKQNLAKDLLKPDKNVEGANRQTTRAFNSEEYINNYLEVMASKSKTVHKKQENKSSSDEATRRSKKSCKSLAPIKFAIGSSMREESNLSEFNIDKVDSWMSTHEQSTTCFDLPKSSKVHEDQLATYTKEWNEAEEDVPDTASELSTKSNESSQEDTTTYDEIVSVIREIEEDKKTDNFAQPRITEMELNLNDEKQRDERLETQIEKGSAERQSSPDKYKDILNYLDDVEDSCDKTLLETRRSIPESNRSEIEFVVEPDIAEDVPKLSDLLMVPNHQLARRVIALSLRANELANAVHLAKENVTKTRSEKQKSIRCEKANTAARMRDQKKHYETIVTRHQGFIEQLLKDKGSLCEKLAALTRRLESQNQAWEHKLQTEVQRVKETTMAGEKIRRERWVRENTKKIKELTVKGLEAEINKMTCNHQREVTELKRAHQQQLLDAVDEARQKHEQIEKTIRDSCAQDRETIIEKERIAIRERFERQLREEKKSCDEQKQKLAEEFAAERERLQAELKEKELEYQAKRQEIQREKEQELQETVAELQEKMSKQDEKYQNRINTIEKQYLADFEIWKRDYENSLKVQQIEKENTIRQHYRAERDRQIDAIVTRMDAEALKNAEEFEAKIGRIKEKYEKDLQAAESVERSLSEKYTDARNRLAESDAQVRNYQAEIKQLQLELGHSKKMCSEFLAEREQVRENLRNEIQNEVVTLRTERDNEIQRIHKRVQQAIEKKDATVELLQKENGSLRERCIKLEAIIRQQRKDYCVK